MARLISCQIACHVCGRKWPSDQVVTSPVTGYVYCPVSEWRKCIAPEKKEAA